MTGGFTVSTGKDGYKDMKKQKFTFVVFMASVLSAIGCFLFGYDTGIVSGSMIYIKEDFNLDSFWQEFEVSITIIGACIFACLSGPSSGFMGRKKMILSAAFVFTLGSIIMAIAWEKYSLLVGRFVAGAGIGYASTTVPTYIAEVAPIQLRGAFVTLSYVFIVLGQLIAAIVAGLCSKLPEKVGWRYMVGLAAVPAAIQCVGFIFMPESPRWLVQRNRFEEAIASLTRIRGTDDVLDEFNAIKSECEEAAKNEQENKSCATALIQAMSEKPTRRAILVGTIVWATHELSGINIMMYYTATIVQMAGVHDKSMAVWIAAAIDAVYTIFTAAGIYLVEKIGRRPLLLTSLFGTIISLAITGAGFLIVDQNSPYTDLNFPVLNSLRASNDRCQNLFACSECVMDPECGFCFIDKGESQWEGSCFNGQQSNAEYGPCEKSNYFIHMNETSQSYPAIWGKDACPSDYGWLIMLMMTIYLCFFGPGKLLMELHQKLSLLLIVTTYNIFFIRNWCNGLDSKFGNISTSCSISLCIIYYCSELVFEYFGHINIPNIN